MSASNKKSILEEFHKMEDQRFVHNLKNFNQFATVSKFVDDGDLTTDEVYSILRILVSETEKRGLVLPVGGYRDLVAMSVKSLD